MILRYEINFWDEVNREPQYEKGIAAQGNTVGEIVNNIYEYYGKNNVESLKIYECDDIMYDEELEEILKDNT